MKLKMPSFKATISVIAVPMILLAVISAAGDALLGLQTLFPLLGFSAGGIAFLLVCLAISGIVALLYFNQDGVRLWKVLRGETEQKALVYAEIDPEVSWLLRSFLRIKIFLIDEKHYSKTHKVAHFMGRLVSVMGAFAAAGGAYLAVQTLLALIGVSSGLGLMIPCFLCAGALFIAFINQDAFSLMEKITHFVETIQKSWSSFNLKRYLKSLTRRQIITGIVSLLIISIAAFAVTGDAFLGLTTLFLALGVSNPLSLIALSVSFAAILGIIYIAQEGFSLQGVLQRIFGEDKAAAVELEAEGPESAKIEYELSSTGAKIAVRSLVLLLAILGGFAVAGGAYLGLEVLLPALGVAGIALIVVASIATVFAGLGYMAQDGNSFYERLKKVFGKPVIRLGDEKRSSPIDASTFSDDEKRRDSILSSVSPNGEEEQQKLLGSDRTTPVAVVLKQLNSPEDDGETNNREIGFVPTRS